MDLSKSLRRPLVTASRLAALPGLSLISEAANRVPQKVDLCGYARCQELANRAARAVANEMQEGWSEYRAAELLNTYLRDLGVRSFFHKSFVWFGERTRFSGVKTYFDYLPSTRVLRPGEVFILDVAPILSGYICDIGYTSALGENAELDVAKDFLRELRTELPRMFAEASARGGAIWDEIDVRIRSAGYDNVHAEYPFSVLGHRVHKVRSEAASVFNFINFGWQSYWEFLSRGLFGQLLNADFAGDLTGLWAIEPHIGAKSFGAKFEEILIVSAGAAKWLRDS